MILASAPSVFLSRILVLAAFTISFGFYGTLEVCTGLLVDLGFAFGSYVWRVKSIPFLTVALATTVSLRI